MPGLYVHIPFCRQKCFYCDFFSIKYADSLSEKYLDALLKHAKKHKTERIDTVYVGGGTPSVLTEKQIEKLLKGINSDFDLSKSKEFTFELNPESVTVEKLKILRDFGVNRLSIGLQSSDDVLLKYLGRVHNYQTFSKVFDMARKEGFENINLDLIYGIPGQTLEIWESNLQNALNFESEHISLYPLTVEEGTEFHKNCVKTDSGLQRAMYDKTMQIFEKAGLEHYEISNWSKPGKESVHNSNYWRNLEYIALGAGASGYLSGRRFKNIDDVEKYINFVENSQNLDIESENIDEETANAEKIMLGLRLLNEGVSADSFKSIKNATLLHEFLDKNMLIKEAGNIKLPKEYIFVSNSIIAEFLP